MSVLEMCAVGGLLLIFCMWAFSPNNEDIF